MATIVQPHGRPFPAPREADHASLPANRLQGENSVLFLQAVTAAQGSWRSQAELSQQHKCGDSWGQRRL